MQTDQPYTYQIPSELAGDLKLGMRVVVPFGRGKRKVQGFIVGFSNHVDYDGKMKQIDSIIDLTPVVNDELLKLSAWLAQTTFSFRISCIMTMLPSVMRAKATKVLRINKAPLEPSIAALFGKQSELEYDEDQFNPDQLKAIIDAVRTGQLTLDYVVKNQARAKQVLQITPAQSVAELKAVLEQVAANAVAQQKLLKWLIEHPDQPIEQPRLASMLQIPISTINTAAKKGWVNKQRVTVLRDPSKHSIARNYPLALNDDQKQAVDQIAASIKNETADVYLLEGVTGSGKTEVYLQAIQKALVAGKTALMLVPEIALTPQMVNRVKGRFGDMVAMLHSGLSIGERYDEWRRINAGDAQVVVGARSAVFAPLKNIGVIIMDEEHDSSYKQEDTPRYNTREVAKWRGAYNHCPVVLGSATPSLESRARAGKDVYHLLMMPHRINNQSLPTVNVVDMRNVLINDGKTDFSEPLLTAIQHRLARKEQTVLMLNRRGYSSFLMCRDCGFVLKCPNCDISLTLHLKGHRMQCHYCGFEQPIPNRCPNCHGQRLRSFGTGTEKVEQQLNQLLPNASVIRMDVDTTKRKGAHERLLAQFGSGQADILLGTQMIAKGLDFPNVTLVGVLNADTSLDLPDFRANEKTFQLLTQVSGRAGRAQKQGEVYIQTYNPDNKAIQLAKEQDYEAFYRSEMRIRHIANYPPYFFTVRITANAKFENQSAKVIYEIDRYLRQTLTNGDIILGPTPSAISRIKNKYYYQLLIKYKHEPKLQSALEHVLNKYQTAIRHGIYISIDSEPVSFM
ncbi:primosomal protein N' [Nicoliella spurrieriana]|uniref:Replication restart protein PriA n=2 Tax=Nicoliella spurrieriana TaxID=2925830 RepID=A0A976RTV2_9LACO|nr:primosomal protein N' [Nicoliella spurrieriana]